MKIYKKIIQKSENWFRIKYGKIGGSTARGLFVKKDKQALFYTLLKEKIEPFFYEEESPFLSKDVERGNLLEPFAKKELENYTGLIFEEIGWVQSDIEILGISPDGLTADQKTACELKCPRGETHLKYIERGNIPPAEYNYQLVNYFATIEHLEVLYFASFRPENIYKPLHVIKLDRGSLIDIGTPAKPKLVSITSQVDEMKDNAIILDAKIKSAIEYLKF